MAKEGLAHDAADRGALVMLTRAPLPGRAKTRMMPQLSASECADLQRCLLQDAALLCRSLPPSVDVFVAYAPEGGREAVSSAFDAPAEYFAQRGRDIGERMLDAARHVLSAGYGRCALIGSDAPELEASDVERALSRLDGCDAAFVPSTDGGYCLIALKAAEEALFSLESYGHGAVLRQTLDAASAAGLSCDVLPAIDDIDCWDDGVALLARAEADPRKRGLSVVRFLRGIEAAR